jgi:serine phosphatase RsbU (regulator of sigma subunit)
VTIPFIRKDKNPYQWFKLCLLIGGALAVLLLVNSVWYYNFIAGRVQLDQVRRELTAQAAGVDQELQSARNLADLKRALEAERQKSDGKIAWIEVRDVSSATVVHEGMPAGRAFSIDYIRAQLRNRQAAFKTLSTAEGTVAVEAFPIHIPGEAGARNFGIIEIASFTRGEDAALWPVRRNLILNCSAAIALLAALGLMANLLRSYIRGKQLEQQLEIAHSVQRDLLPSTGNLPEQFQLAAEYQPATHLSGDFYDLLPAGNEGAAFVLGDVSGKGIPAALLMGVLQGAIRSAPWTESAEQHEEATSKINRMLCERASRERYSTLFWSYFEPGTETLRYINAGHCAPLLFKQNGEARRLNDGGPVLGLLADAQFHQSCVRFESGDTLVLYSDGIVEAANPNDEQFGEDRLQDLVGECLRQSPAEIRGRILDEVNRFTGNAELSDDRTLVVVRYTGSVVHGEGTMTEDLAVV